jgi:preprotein translocase subunit YajC
MTDIVLAILASNALFAFIQFLIQRHDQKKQSPERMMLKALGEDRLAVLLKDWLHADVRTATEWKTITALYKGYKALGGNDGIDKLYAEAKEIPTTE